MKQHKSAASDLLGGFGERFEARQSEEMSIKEYLERCKTDPSLYASIHSRLLKAIGKPTLVDTAKNPRLGRIFGNRVIKTYEPFSDFYGIEEAIERIVSFLVRAEQGLHERKMMLYLLGPVGGGKSSLVTRLLQLAEQEPIYVLKVSDEDAKKHGSGVSIPSISPIFESPLGLFSSQQDRALLHEQYNIPDHRIPTIMSPWATKRLREFKGDLSCFRVMKIFPSLVNQIGIAITEPGDENNQDISDLVGKTSIRMLDEFEQSDTDSYSYSGALNLGCQGMVEFREMFKAPIKTLNPLLFATQDGHYKTTEGLPAVPFDGLVVAHSNESEWDKFRNDKRNEAFIDRIKVIKVPYTLRVSEEMKIYKKMVAEGGALANKPIAPMTLELLASFSVLTRMADPEDEATDSTWGAKLRVYDGEDLKDRDPKAKTLKDYRAAAGINEGMTGMSTRFAFAALGETFNYDHEEIGANPVHLLAVLEEAVRQSDLNNGKDIYINTFIRGMLTESLQEHLEKDLRTALVDSYNEYGQSLFERYVTYADHWCRGDDYRDPDTATDFDSDELNEWLEEIEKPAGIANPKDFRNEVVQFVLRARADNGGTMPKWTAYRKIKDVLEKTIFAKTDDLLPVISFDTKKSAEDEEKHEKFVENMVAKGYTNRQVQILVEWHRQKRKRS